MIDVREKPKMVERALLVRVCLKPEDPEVARDLLEELRDLVDTLGIPVMDHMQVRSDRPHPRLLVGPGKAEAILARAEEVQADVIIVDNDLSPAQQRSWEQLSKRCVIDRQEVILDIFGKRALSREARLQVELARMEYSLPRLTRAWTHLERQSGAGGVGLRGTGEKQLETDRRLVRRRIDTVKRELSQVRQQRATQRKERLRIPLPHAAIVGYTNAGKSSLLQRLTGADVLVEDQLFATLDTTTRKVRLPDGQHLLLTDTVGFVRNLPHGLVEAFKATLEEAVLADFRIHVVDASHPRAVEFYRTTMAVLDELGADPRQTLTVCNKLDRVDDPATIAALRHQFPEATFLSARTGEGVDRLLDHCALHLKELVATLRYRFPVQRADLISTLYDFGKVLRTEYDGDDVFVEAVVPCRLRNRFETYEMNGTSADPASVR